MRINDLKEIKYLLEEQSNKLNSGIKKYKITLLLIRITREINKKELSKNRSQVYAIKKNILEDGKTNKT